MYAEPLGARPSQGTSRASPSISVATNSSPMQTPMSRNMSPDVASVQDTLAGMSVHRVASHHDQVELAARMMSPASSVGEH